MNEGSNWRPSNHCGSASLDGRISGCIVDTSSSPRTDGASGGGEKLRSACSVWLCPQMKIVLWSCRFYYQRDIAMRVLQRISIPMNSIVCTGAPFAGLHGHQFMLLRHIHIGNAITGSCNN